MEDLQNKIIELMDLFDDEQVTTADKIDRPEKALERQAIDDFMKRNPMAGGGMLVQPSADGSRPGYADDDRFIRTEGSGKQKSEEMVKFLNYATNNKNKIKNKTLTEIIEASGANVDKSNARKRLKENKIKIGTADQSKVIKEVKSKTEKPVFDGINNFAKNWINKNQKKYGVTEYDKFISNFANDWQKELSKPLYKNYGGDRILSNPDGTPKTNTTFGKQETGFTINGLKPPNERTSGLFYKRVFYKNKLKNKDFKKKVNNYLDWVLQDKRGKGDFGLQGGGKSNYLKAAQKIGLDIDKDVLYFFGEVMQGDLLTAGEGFYSIVDKEIGGNKASKYKNKLNISYQNWINNIEEVSKLAGVDPKVILNNQLKEAKKMTALFGLEKLPFEFRYAQDHLFGLAEAKSLGDPKIAKQTLKNLVASTKEQNYILGTKGFSAKRTALIKRFKNASLENKANIVNELNTLAEEYVPGRLQYNVKKDGSLKITNLQPETTFKARTEAYKKITETFPKKIQNLSDGPSFGSLDVGSMFKKLSPGAKKVVGFGGGTVLPEVLFYQLDKANRMSKGVSEKEAAAGALESGTLGAYTDKAYMEELKKVAESMGIDSSAFDSAYQLNVLSKSYEQNSKNVDAQIATALENQDIKTAEELRLNFNKYLARIKPEAERLRNDIEERVTGGSPLTMAMGRGNVTDEQYSKPFYDMQDVAMEKLKKEKQKVFDTQKRQVDTAAGNIGEGFYQAFDSLTQGAKNLLKGRIIPFGPDRLRPLESDREREARYLKEMDPRELFLYNKARGYTYDNPITEGDLMNLQMEQPGLFFAGGGIAKLAGVDQGPPPESGPNSQGLQGLFNRVKKV